MTLKTLLYYSSNPTEFWQGTKDHDVSQNINALLSNIQKNTPYKILDFGCGPGRDLLTFEELGHQAYGLDGCREFCEMAQEHSSCVVYNQDFIDVDLADNFYDGIFANASLFHVPKENLSDLIKKFYNSLTTGGILFSSNPRGNGEDIHGERCANFMEIEEYKKIVEDQGFKLINHYYRPAGKPVDECPWLACIFVKK